jgi:hypothetical protein
MKFQINQQVILSDGTKAIFLGLQFNPRFGFFREVLNPDTFFGWRMSKVKKLA